MTMIEAPVVYDRGDVRGETADYKEVPIVDSGFAPSGHLVLIYPDPISEYSPGGISLPAAKVEQEYLAQVFALMVRVGPNAWFDEPTPRAIVGQRVMVAKFTGQIFKGSDGRRYRLVNDKDILGVVTGEGVTV